MPRARKVFGFFPIDLIYNPIDGDLQLVLQSVKPSQRGIELIRAKRNLDPDFLCACQHKSE